MGGAGGEAHVAIRLYNADGSDSEISGNGTRCAAALAVDAGLTDGSEVRILTGAGLKKLWLKESGADGHVFEMHMGQARVEHLRHSLPVPGAVVDATILNVGNPQCAVFVPDFDFKWEALGAEIETHAQFPNRTNVSFVTVVSDNTIKVRIWERGVGVTESSGTGATGAAAAAFARGLVQSPVTVLTPAGPLLLRWESSDMYLTGPAAIVATGEFQSADAEPE